MAAAQAVVSFSFKIAARLEEVDKVYRRRHKYVNYCLSSRISGPERNPAFEKARFLSLMPGYPPLFLRPASRRLGMK